MSTGSQYYRFATFVWKYNGNLSGISKFNFVFNNFKYNSASPTIVYDANSNGTYYISNSGNTQRFIFNYRVEEIVGGTPYITPSSSQYTTAWVDGNSNLYGTQNISTPYFGNTNPAYGEVGGGNYYVGNDTIMYAGTSTITYSSPNLTINAASILFNPNRTYYVYARIGFPMIANYSFSNVTFSMS